MGLDIGDGYVAAARVQPQKDGRLLLTHAGVVECDAGLSDKQIAQAIKGLWRRQRFTVFTVCSCMHGQSLTVRNFRFANLAETQLGAALRLEAEELLQMPQDRIVIDWHVSRTMEPQAGGEGRRVLEGIIVMAPRSEIERHRRILELAGLYPVVMDVGCLAIGNLYLALKGQAPEGGICIVSMGRRSADVCVLSGSDTIYPRTVFSRAPWSEGLDYLVTSVQDLLRYYQFKLRRNPVEQLLVCGQIPKTSDFERKLGEAIGVAVTRWNPLNDLPLSVRASRATAGRGNDIGPVMAASVGLALRRD
jgi:Tfp pilus assembly PilM family ATPase